MKTPVKIYLTEDNPSKEWYRTKQVGFDSIEYIRKDAFIEKAVSFIRNCTSYDGLGYKTKCVNIEDFKKDMEDEL